MKQTKEKSANGQKISYNAKINNLTRKGKKRKRENHAERGKKAQKENIEKAKVAQENSPELKSIKLHSWNCTGFNHGRLSLPLYTMCVCIWLLAFIHP